MSAPSNDKRDWDGVCKETTEIVQSLGMLEESIVFVIKTRQPELEEKEFCVHLEKDGKRVEELRGCINRVNWPKSFETKEDKEKFAKACLRKLYDDCLEGEVHRHFVAAKVEEHDLEAHKDED